MTQMKCGYYFRVREEGSLHESRVYPSKKKAQSEAKKYLKGPHGRYSFPETLKVVKTCV